jgi:hypothetical protein
MGVQVRRSMMLDVSRCLDGLASVQSDAKDLLDRMNRQLELREEKRAQRLAVEKEKERALRPHSAEVTTKSNTISKGYSYGDGDNTDELVGIEPSELADDSYSRSAARSPSSAAKYRSPGRKSELSSPECDFNNTTTEDLSSSDQSQLRLDLHAASHCQSQQESESLSQSSSPSNVRLSLSFWST